MRKVWESPKMDIQEFVAQEYVAGCAVNVEGQYIFTCDAPAGTTVYPAGENDWVVGGGRFTPCGATHVVTDPNSYELRYLITDADGDGYEEEDIHGPYLFWNGPWTDPETGEVKVGHFTASLTYKDVENKTPFS